MSAANVIGLDLSITATGIAAHDGTTTTIKHRANLGDRRLCAIVEAVRLACRWPGDVGFAELVVIEDLPTHAHGAGITGMVHGAVRAFLLDHHLAYVTVPPATLKKYATGKGNSGKPEMAVAAFKRAGAEFGDDNACDAWWLRAMGLDALGASLFTLPAGQRDALAKVAWPELGAAA